MRTELQKFEFASPIGSIESYTQWVNRIPMLTAEEEYELATRYRNESDLAAAKQLVLAHLRFVVKVARGYAGYGLSHNDLIQEGNVGLMKAVKRFDPEVGVRLVTFAIHWIKAEIHEFILKNWRIVKVATTKAQRKLFFNLRKLKARIGSFTSTELQQVAEDLGVEKRDVLEMETRLAAHDMTFDAPDDVDGEQHLAFAPAHYLEDKRYDPARLVESNDWTEQSNQNLHAVLEKLDERSQDIIHQRWFIEEKATLHDLAKKYGVSAERVRQLEQNAFKKLKEALSSN